MPSGQETDLS